jgi:hypothetical protein
MPADKDSFSPYNRAKRIYDASSFVSCLKLSGYTYRKTVKSAVDSFLAAAATSIIFDIIDDKLRALLSFHYSADRIFRPDRIVSVSDISECPRSGLMDNGDQFIIDKYFTVADDHCRPGIFQLRVAPDIYFVPNTFIKGANLTIKGDFTTTESSAGSQGTTPKAIKSQ